MNDGLEQMKRLLHNGISEYRIMIASREIGIKAFEGVLKDAPISNLHRILAAMKGELALLTAAKDRREKAIVIVVEMEIALQDSLKSAKPVDEEPPDDAVESQTF